RSGEGLRFVSIRRSVHGGGRADRGVSWFWHKCPRTCAALRAGTERFSQMAKNIYVGNLVWDATSDDLLELFGQFGKVARVQVITGRGAGRSRGFGFVEMENDAEAQKAIEGLNNVNHKGRPLTVNEAKPREERGPGGGGGGGGRGFGGGGGGGRGPGG